MTPLTRDLLRSLKLPVHRQGDNKEGRGQILIVGGCLSLPGAILLGAEGAMRAGAGKLQIATCRSVAPQLGLAMPEAMVVGLPETEGGCIAAGAKEALGRLASSAAAVLVGPGMMDAESTRPVLTAVLEAADPRAGLVLDAGALHVLPDCEEQLRRSGCPAIVTPHAGEMARLLGVPRTAIDEDPLHHATAAAARFRCTVVLKGGTTHIVDPDGTAWMFEGGTIGLATSGSGDVLAGVIAGLLARGATSSSAALWGVYLHAEAGCRLTRRYGGIGLLARELPGEIPSIMAGLCP